MSEALNKTRDFIISAMGEGKKTYTALEEAVIKIANILMESQGTNYVFLPMIISLGQAGGAHTELEIAATIYKLRYRTIFDPIDPISEEI